MDFSCTSLVPDALLVRLPRIYHEPITVPQPKTDTSKVYFSAILQDLYPRLAFEMILNYRDQLDSPNSFSISCGLHVRSATTIKNQTWSLFLPLSHTWLPH